MLNQRSTISSENILHVHIVRRLIMHTPNVGGDLKSNAKSVAKWDIWKKFAQHKIKIPKQT